MARTVAREAPTYPVGMARSPLTLAALATSAVADLDVAGVARLGSPDGGSAESALVTTRDGRGLVVRVPRSAEVESEQTAELLSLRALTAGVRSRLPFDLPLFAGQAPLDGIRVVVSDYVPGERTAIADAGPALLGSIGAAIAAIHSLPTSCVTEVGLPSLGPVHAHQTSGALVQRSIATGVLPAALRERWDAALGDDRLWQFQPTVINGALSTDTVRSDGDRVTGILAWSELRVADPAKDLAWLFAGRRSEVADAAAAAYLHARPGADRLIAPRATFYAELEIAKWLLHGTETRSTDIVDDAVQMLHGLVDDVHSDLMNPLGPPTAPILAVGDVEALLDRVERVG